MSCFAVVYSNYFPYEIDSLWSSREKAQVRASIMNGEGLEEPWHVEEITIHG